MATEDFEQYILQYENEKPKIDSALKNLISIIVGKSLTSTETDISSGSISFSSNQAFTCAKVLLKCVQNYELPNYIEFSTKYLQHENQSGIQRIIQLSKYKALLLLRNRIISNNQSINKFFGKSYFLDSLVFNDLKESILQTIESNGVVSISMEQAQYFVNLFEKSLTDEDSLVWASDFTESVWKISQQRMETIKQQNSTDNNEL